MIIIINNNSITFLARAGATSSKSSSVRFSTSKKGNVKISDEVKSEKHLERCGFDLACMHTNVQMNYFKTRVSTVIYEVIASLLSLFQ